MIPAACGIPVGANQSAERRTAQTRLDLSHRRAQGPRRQDDRVHAHRGRRRDVRHDRLPPRGRPGCGDRSRILEFRSAAGSSLPALADLRRRQPRLCLLVGRQDGRRATDCPRHCGRPAVLPRRENRPARPAISAKTGILDLRLGLAPNVASLAYGPTSAPAIWKDTVIVGVSCGEGPELAAPGDIRAFDVRTGREVWRFRTVPGPGEVGHETWEGDSWKDRGGVNAWGGFSVDMKRGLVFAGLGSAAFDFYGGDRRGTNLFANCTIALERKNGRTRVAFSDAPSRLVGSRSAGVPEPGHRHARGQASRRRRPGDEDGLRLPVRPRDRQAALCRRRESRAPV